MITLFGIGKVTNVAYDHYPLGKGQHQLVSVAVPGDPEFDAPDFTVDVALPHPLGLKIQVGDEFVVSVSSRLPVREAPAGPSSYSDLEKAQIESAAARHRRDFGSQVAENPQEGTAVEPFATPAAGAEHIEGTNEFPGDPQAPE